MSYTVRRLVVLGIIGFTLLNVGAIFLLPAPRNPVWHLFSGYYRYDPRLESPPPGLVLDLPEASLTYYMDATLAKCDRRYHPVSNMPVQDYKVELVEYFGKTNYHAWSYVHTRLVYADNVSVPVIFLFEAGHNEADIWYFEHGSTIRSGSWFAVGGLFSAPQTPPPGWNKFESNDQNVTCEQLGSPFSIGW